MSLDRSLKGKSTLERHRNVLRRSERIVMLEENEKWREGKNSVFSLVKVAHRKQVAAKKVKAEVAVEGAAATPVAGAVAAVPGAKPAAGAAPAPAAAAGAKAAAPAAKAPKK